MAIVYLIKNGEDYFKIGYTSRNVERRLEELQVASPTKLEVIHQYKTDDPTLLESTLHRQYRHARMEGEWFKLAAEEIGTFIQMCSKIEHNIAFLKANQI